MSNERNSENGKVYEEGELDTIILILEDGGEIECGILGIFGVEGYDSDYITLVPEDGNRVMIYKYEEIDEEGANLDVIKDGAEYKKARETFESLFVDFGGEDKK